MNLIPVSSSNISSIGYERGTLYVRFHSGQMYAYFNVPEIIYNNLMNASSKGKYFEAHIKNNYRYAKIS